MLRIWGSIPAALPISAGPVAKSCNPPTAWEIINVHIHLQYKSGRRLRRTTMPTKHKYSYKKTLLKKPSCSRMDVHASARPAVPAVGRPRPLLPQRGRSVLRPHVQAGHQRLHQQDRSSSLIVLYHSGL